ncbi:MAG: c-type cytochrome domain-containing protein, partial [Bryobacteraceae bacterium]
MTILTAAGPLFAQSTDHDEFFEKKIRPMLVASCSGCHNPKVKTAGLDLTTAEGFQHGGESGALVSKENPG